jgi:hypothetical protein
MTLYNSQLKYHLRTLWNPIEIALWANLFGLLIWFYSNSERMLSGIIIMNAFMFFIIMLPDIIKYFGYLKVSKGILVAVDNDKRQITIQKDSHIREFSFDDIKSITRICTERAGSRKKFNPHWGDFYYFEIDLKNKAEIIITSLMTDEGTIDIDGKENQTLPQGNAWISIQGRNVLNLQLVK